MKELKLVLKNLKLKKKSIQSCKGRERGVDLGRAGGEYHQNILYEILKELIKILLAMTFLLKGVDKRI